MRKLALAAALLLGCAHTQAPASSPIAEAPRPIAWRSYDASAFADAAREDKLVLVDVGIEGCTACRWMYEETYKNAGVAKRLSEGFVTISVDADVQPDLGVRFEEWGWPATIFMTAKGEQVLALRGSRSPEVFAKILDDVMKQKKEGTLHASTDEGAGESHVTALRDACMRVERVLDEDMNKEHGGWSEDSQFIQGPAIELAFARAKTEGRPELRKHALKTLDGYAKMIDPEWGGVYVAAHNVDFTGVIVEKRLVQEAETLRSFALAYGATHDEKWIARAKDIDRYLAGFLLAPDGTFWSTQQDEAPNLPAGMSSGEYFSLPDKERRKYGVPPVDHAVYTDQNGQAIEAYAMLYEATHDAQWLARATRAADVILKTRIDPSGFVAQAAPSSDLASDARKRAFRASATPYLTAQAHFANALVALHRVTGEARWLDAARGIMTAARRDLEDTKEGGFFASTRREDKTTYENVVAARVLHALAVYTHDEALDRVAERTMKSLPSFRGAVVALAAQDLAIGSVEISVAGSPDDARSKALYAAALDVHETRKAVHWDTAHKYPERGKPALYACTRDSCSKPVYDPSGVAAAVASVTPARRSACE